MKEQLLKYLKNKTTSFSIEEMNVIINMVSQLEEPSKETKKKTNKK